MADDSHELDQSGNDGEINFTFEDGVEENAAGDDFDFDLGVGEPQAVGEESMQSSIAPALGEREIDADEIDYDDDEDVSTAQGDGQVKPALPQGDEAAASTEKVTDLDEIDYEDDDDFGAAAGASSGSAQESEQDVRSTTHQGDDEEPAGDLDFGLDQSNNGPNTAADQAAGLEALNKELGVPFQESADELSAEAEIADQTFGNNVDSLDFDAAGLGGGYSAFPLNITVVWGNEVCPLFKTDETDDPESFYLDDVGVLDLPLSGFLAAIRASISKWVSENHEIHLRVNELGIEFGETTTEALLEQSTFGHLIALHSVLSRNDDPSASASLSLKLTTRPNCALRVKELVEAANSGKGLSAVQAQSLPSEDSSQVAYGEQDSPEDGSEAVADEMTEAYDQVGTDEQDSDSAGYTGAGSQDDLVDYEAPGPDQESSPDAGEDDFDNMQQEYIDALDSPHGVEGAHHTPGNQYDTGVSHGDASDALNDASHGLAAVAPDGREEPDFLSYGDGEIPDDPAADELLDFSGEADIPQGDTGQLGDDSGPPGFTNDGPSNRQALPLDNAGQQQDDFDDEYLDLSGDIEESGPVTADEQPGTVNSAAGETIGASNAPDPGASQRASTTPTMGEDEIDYDDDPIPAVPYASASATPSKPTKVYKEDEIDWDDEDKIIAPTAALPPASNIPAKRSRDGDEDDGLHNDGPDAKRQRPEHAES